MRLEILCLIAKLKVYGKLQNRGNLSIRKLRWVKQIFLKLRYATV